MTCETFEFAASDGVALHVYRWSPQGSPRAVVHIAHGMGEHAARYARPGIGADDRRL